MVIGRNEGQRLRRSLIAAMRESRMVVYVDSGSSDGSCELARSLGAEVVPLDSAIPFTAARARNAGFEFLMNQNPQPEAVQFVDGDCELREGWLGQAQAELERGPGTGAVFGRQQERFPDSSVFNKLIDLECSLPAGDVDYFGGCVLIRSSAFRQAGGFNAAMIAGEDPELSLRLRRQGWKILRLPVEMTLHDANMTRFGQWWRRSIRSGHAYAEGAWMHGLEAERHWLRQSLSIWFWGLALPVCAVVMAGFSPVAAALAAALYPALLCRVYWRARGRMARADAALYGLFCLLIKFPQVWGQIRFFATRLAGRRSGLIEYKTT